MTLKATFDPIRSILCSSIEEDFGVSKTRFRYSFRFLFVRARGFEDGPRFNFFESSETHHHGSSRFTLLLFVVDRRLCCLKWSVPFEIMCGGFPIDPCTTPAMNDLDHPPLINRSFVISLSSRRSNHHDGPKRRHQRPPQRRRRTRGLGAAAQPNTAAEPSGRLGHLALSPPMPAGVPLPAHPRAAGRERGRSAAGGLERRRRARARVALGCLSPFAQGLYTVACVMLPVVNPSNPDRPQ